MSRGQHLQVRRSITPQPPNPTHRYRSINISRLRPGSPLTHDPGSPCHPIRPGVNPSPHDPGAIQPPPDPGSSCCPHTTRGHPYHTATPGHPTCITTPGQPVSTFPTTRGHSTCNLTRGRSSSTRPRVILSTQPVLSIRPGVACPAKLSATLDPESHVPYDPGSSSVKELTDPGSICCQ